MAAEQVAVVTGGNTGIGLATAVGIARTGTQVVLTSRDDERGQAALAEVREASGNDRVDVLPLDLASFDSIRSFVERFRARHDRLDILVNNAGVAPAGRRWETEEGFEAAFGVNHVGHFLLTGLLLDELVAAAPSRIVVVSSGAYLVAAKEGLCFDDLQHTGEFHSMRVYGESKLANIYFTVELARRLDGTGVTVNALNPGYVATELGHIRPEDEARSTKPASRPAGPGFGDLPEPKTPEEGARTPLLLALSDDVAGVSGAYYSEGEREELVGAGADADAARRLWTITEELVARHHPRPLYRLP